MGWYAVGKDFAKGPGCYYVSSLLFYSSFPLASRADMEQILTISCLSGNGSKDVAEVLLTLKKKEWADRLDWQVAQ